MSRSDLPPELLREALAETLGDSLGAEAPPPTLRSRLIAAATTGPMRHAPFFDELARLFDLVKRLKAQLGSADAGGEAEDVDHLLDRQETPVPAAVAADRHVNLVPRIVQNRLESPVRPHAGTNREQGSYELGSWAPFACPAISFFTAFLSLPTASARLTAVGRDVTR